jgi:hypothetical protein
MTGAKKSKDALDSNEKSAKLLSRALIALASTAVIAVAKTANELENCITHPSVLVHLLRIFELMVMPFHKWVVVQKVQFHPLRA